MSSYQTHGETRLLPVFPTVHRADLTALERDEHVAEWIKLAEQKAELKSAQPAQKSKTARNPKGSGRKEGGISAASRELGIDRDAARRARKVAGLSDAANKAANGTHADCIRIITRAEMRMATEIDKGREEGLVVKNGGDRSTVRGPDIATLADMGVSRQRVAEWRDLRDAGEIVHGSAARLRPTRDCP